MTLFDLRALAQATDEDIARVREELLEEKVLVFTNHGLDADLLARKAKLDKEAFLLPEVHRYQAAVINASGYFSEGKEYANSPRKGDKKRMWQVYRELMPDHPLYESYNKNVWPTELPEFKEASLQVYAAFDRVANDMLRVIERTFSFPSNYLTTLAHDGDSVLRTNYYPPLTDLVSQDYGLDRSNAHTDINLITIMLAPSQGGLQVWNRHREWRDIEAPEGSLIVTTGKMLMALTGAAIKASWHRVVDPVDQSKERFSMPFFVHPKPLDILEAMPQFLTETSPALLPAMTRTEFMSAVRENTHGVRDWLNGNGDRP